MTFPVKIKKTKKTKIPKKTKTPSKPKKEAVLQIAFINHLKTVYAPLGVVFCASRGEVKIHSNVKDWNGRSIGERIGSDNKRMGYYKGIPDITIYLKRGPYGALLIEFKREGEDEKPEQKQVKKLLRASGYCVQTIYDLATAILVMESYWKLKDAIPEDTKKK